MRVDFGVGVDIWAGVDFGQVDADRKEVTLDDLWSLDLAKLAEYKEVNPFPFVPLEPFSPEAGPARTRSSHTPRSAVQRIWHM